ncbi:ABC transporter ATP-binding protein [Sneathiella aquimaris]|uniref:ABC transporter ATP-binding protein n=1 Tax=Sneathiella aquimaris TaxID=2599305 RepID=UPI00146D127C|nr:ABC transporter ATP-binding protein [Sneathiella aquimaris]
MLELKNVSKKVGTDYHIRDVSMTLEKGSLNVLLGPTLSGKTTLMRLMAGLDKPTDGDIRVAGKSVVGVPVQKRNVAMVYQQFINYPAMTVYENIASPMRIAGKDAAEIDRRVRHAADMMKLGDYLDRTPLNLSGGQQQRTALARALVKDAELVLLDEPLANLDYKLREELRIELPRVFAETGAIFVYATTEPHEALLLGGSTATLSEGRVTQFGQTISVHNRPVDLKTAQTFSDPPLNLLEMTKTEKGFSFDGQTVAVEGELAQLPDGTFMVGVRPHHMALAPEADGSMVVDATVATSEITGSESFIHAEKNGSRWVALTHGVHRVNTGDPIKLFLDPHSFFVFGHDGKLVAAPSDPEGA